MFGAAPAPTMIVARRIVHAAPSPGTITACPIVTTGARFEFEVDRGRIALANLPDSYAPWKRPKTNAPFSGPLQPRTTGRPMGSSDQSRWMNALAICGDPHASGLSERSRTVADRCGGSADLR